MVTLELKTNPEVELVFNTYPGWVRKKISALRGMILEAANEMEEITELKETLK